MDSLRLVALLVYTFGAFAYGAILVLWVRELGALGWKASGPESGRSAAARPPREMDVVNGALVLVSFAWFVLNLGVLLMELGAQRRIADVAAATLVVAFLFPPLIMHTAWVETVLARGRRRSLWWRRLLWGAYAVAVVTPAWCFLVFMDPASTEALRQNANRAYGASLSLLFIGAAIYSSALARRDTGEPPRAGGQSFTWLYGLMVLLFVAIFLISTVAIDSRAAIAATAVSIAARSLPLLFLFVSAYYENRFRFFDLFVKLGLALLMAVVVLTLWFAALLPLLRPLATTWAAPWIFAVVVVPVVAVMPLLYAVMARALDRRWLGRQFTTVEAVTRFLARLRPATSETALVAEAESGLSEIFNAPAAVRLDGAEGATFGVQQEIAVPSSEDGAARRVWFLLGQRVNDAPYFSQDVALLRTLAEVFGSALENVRLQERRLEQEQRARALSLDASRSELKALRAQINPHFLFNALNAIAGHIHRDPAVADRTIEQLAEVFRYALRGAEHEWARLDEEMDFVRAYLDVERARFGERLQTVFDVEPGVRRLRLPTMMLQTLVENAVKHGASVVRGRATVRIDAQLDGGRLVVSVTDNGPGLDADRVDSSPQRGGGYGLLNIRERLRGYFGEAAELTVERDSTQGLTKVSIILPAVVTDPSLAMGAVR